ncbi:MAG: hypothetical protein AB7F35_13710 [Acetobacteraceae bacterium]
MRARTVISCSLAAGLAVSSPAYGFLFGNSVGLPTDAQLLINGSTMLPLGDAGWYRAVTPTTADTNSELQNYLTGGTADLPYSFRSYFAFSLAGVGTVTSASLSLASYNVTTTETFTLHGPGVDPAGLLAGTGGIPTTAGHAVWQALGSGTSYGSRNYVPGDSGSTVSIVLNEAFLADINTAIIQGAATFVVGGAVDSGLAPVAEPLSWVFAGPLLLLGSLRRRSLR